MALKDEVKEPTVFTDEHGKLKIGIRKRKPEDQDRVE